MNYVDANHIATQLLAFVQGVCALDEADEPLCKIGGGLRRQKKDVHDIEIIAKPDPSAPRLEFGMPAYRTRFDQVLAGLVEDGYLSFVKGGEKYKKYSICTEMFGVAKPINPFHVEFWLVTPPAQFGVDLMIRTGPGSEDDNFSKWIVTPRKDGGKLPDGYRVRGAAVWHEEQLDAKSQPMKGETPLSMPTEMSFFQFLEMRWIEPKDRHAMWSRR